MKNISTLIIFLFLGIALHAQAKMELKSETIDYGSVLCGSNGERTFVFTNTGNKPLIIKEVKSSCDCIVPTKPKNEIAPGETGEIKIKYDTSREGPFRKLITVYSNSEGNSPQPLRIKGEVLPKKN